MKTTPLNKEKSAMQSIVKVLVLRRRDKLMTKKEFPRRKRPDQVLEIICAQYPTDPQTHLELCRELAPDMVIVPPRQRRAPLGSAIFAGFNHFVIRGDELHPIIPANKKVTE